MVNTYRQGRVDYIWFIIIFYICSCTEHSKKTLHQSIKHFDNDQQWVYRIDERLTNKFLGCKLRFSGRAKRIDSTSSDLKTVLLEIIDNDNKYFIPIDHIYFTKPISDYFFSFLFKRSATKKEIDLFSEIIKYFAALQNCASNQDVYRLYRTSSHLQDQLANLIIAQSSNPNEFVFQKMRSHIYGIRSIENERSIRCADILFWQSLAKKTNQFDDLSFFNLLDDIYTDHLACSYTSYQIPDYQFEQICSRVGSFTHFNLLQQIDQQIKHQSIFYNELVQLSDQLMDDLILSNYLWYSVDEALIEIDSIDKADFSHLTPSQKIELKNRREHFKDAHKFGIIDQQYEG